MEGSRKVKLFILAMAVSVLVFILMLYLMEKSSWISLYEKFNQTLQWLFGLFVGGNGVEHISKKLNK